MKPAVTIDQPSSSVSLGRPRSIVVIDDDAKTANVLVKLLRVDGFHVESFTAVGPAMRHLARGPLPDFLVIDVSPARIGEVDAVRQIQAEHASLAIILVTAHPQLAEGLARAAATTCQVVTKPIDYPRLMHMLQAHA